MIALHIKTPLSWVAEVTNLSLNDHDSIGAVRDLLFRFPLIIVKGQSLTKEQFESAMKKIGLPVEQKFTKSFVVEIGGRSKTQLSATSELGWHADQSYEVDYPDFLCLYGVNIPQELGCTHWANTQIAFETLPPGARAEIDNLQATHELGHFNSYLKPLMEFESEKHRKLSYAFDRGIQPVVNIWQGKRHLCVNRGFTKEIMGARADLLDTLLDHIESPNHIYSHHWETGDFIFANNHLLIHRRDRFLCADRLLFRGLINLR